MCWLASAGAQDLQTIELRHRLADQVIPALQPLLEPGGVITGMDAMLFIRTSPGNFEQLRQAVSVLDRESRQLRLTVGQGTVVTETRAAARGSATVGSGDIQVGVNRPPAAATGIAVTASHSSQRADLRNISSVTTLEGAEAYIAIGQNTGYRDASTGFYATPRVNGDLVTLDLAPHQQRFSGSPTDRRVETAGLTTQVSGRLGEWIRVGGSSESSRGDSGGLLTWGTRSGEASYSVWVKVEEMP
jgi:type II secretory pathway component GspD/PulD (secretin)